MKKKERTKVKKFVHHTKHDIELGKVKNFDARFKEFNKFEKRSGRRKGLIFSFDSLKFDNYVFTT